MNNGTGTSTRLSSLLLLPPPPYPATASSLKAAYYPSVAATLSKLQSLKEDSSEPAVLEVLIACPELVSRLHGPRSELFDTAQKLLASVYSLICIVCAKESIPSDGAGGTDCRVILLAHDFSKTSQDEDHPTQSVTTGGPIVDLPTFALTRRKWHFIFSADGEKGEAIFNQYIGLANRTSPPVQGEIHTVAGGISMVAQPAQHQQNSTTIAHSVVAVGGTFDHLHAGHKLLLTATSLLVQPRSKTGGTPGRIIVGITGDELLKNKKYSEYLMSWSKRQEDVVEFLTSILCFSPVGKTNVETLLFDEPVVNGRAVHTLFKNEAITLECVEIQDPFGPTITDETITALVVSGETRSGGAAVNDKRTEKGWQPLEVFEVDVLDALDEEESSTATNGSFAAKISSTAIRKSLHAKASI
jgi:phosphopantetheine adenylyltransferase